MYVYMIKVLYKIGIIIITIIMIIYDDAFTELGSHYANRILIDSSNRGCTQVF